MIFSTTHYKNGKRWGKMAFNTGKSVILTPLELAELEHKIADWQLTAELKVKQANGLCFTCGQTTGDEPCDHIHNH